MLPNITPLYFLRSNIIYFVQNKPIEICQIPHVNFELTTQFLFKFCFIFHWYDTKLPCQFLAHTYFTLDEKIPSKSQFFDFPVFWWKFPKFLMSFLKVQVSFRWSVASIFSAIKYNSSILYLSQTLYNLVKGSPLKVKFFRFLSARVKIHQSLHLNFVTVIFRTTSQFFFKFCITL